MSGSESDPSVDNIEDHMLSELQGLIKKQNKRIALKKKKLREKTSRKQTFIDQLKNFDKKGMNAT